MNAGMRGFYSTTPDIANSYMDTLRVAFEEHDDDISSIESICKGGNDWGMVVLMWPECYSTGNPLDFYLWRTVA